MNGKPHALVLDDNSNNLILLQRLLKLAGMNCTVLQDSTRIEEVLSQLDQVDLVLLDLGMPGLDGYEVLALLRNRIGFNAPIVACTVGHNVMPAAKRLGFDGYLGKPLSVDAFPDQIQRILSGQPVWEENNQ